MDSSLSQSHSSSNHAFDINDLSKSSYQQNENQLRLISESNNISNNYIRELAASQGLSFKNYNSLIAEKKEKKKLMNDNMKKLIEGSERKWLESRGKKELIDFTDEVV